MSRIQSEKVEPAYYEMEIPKRFCRALGPEARGLVDMPVDEAAMLFFPMPTGMEVLKFSQRMGSHIVVAKRHQPGARYLKRYVEIEGQGGFAVWRVE